MNNTCGMCGVQIRADQSRCEDCWAEYAVRQAGEMLWPEAAIRANLDANRLLAEKIEGANAEQIGGEHYKGQAIQTWDFIAANNLGYFEGNVVKYIARWRNKGGVEDLRKARHYLDKLIELEVGK